MTVCVIAGHSGGVLHVIWKDGKTYNSVDDCLIAQIISHVVLPVQVRTGVPWSFSVPWISNAGLFHNKIVVFNNIHCVLLPTEWAARRLFQLNLMVLTLTGQVPENEAVFTFSTYNC